MNTKTSCQCCLVRPPFKNLNTPYPSLGKPEIYSDMLKELFQLHLTRNDKDLGICAVCVCRLKDAHDFKLQVQHSQAVLRDLEDLPEPQDKVEALSVKSESSSEDVTNHGEPTSVLHKDPLGTPEMLEDDEKEDTLHEIPSAEIKPESKDDEPTVFSDDDSVILIIGETEDEHRTLETLKATDTKLAMIDFDKAADVTIVTYECEKCHDTIDSSSLTSHTCYNFGEESKILDNTVERRTAIDSFICDTCGNFFTEKSSFTNHLKIHDGENERKSIKNTVILNGKSKVDVKIYPCKICKKNFRGKEVLTAHLQTHRGGEPYSCSTCHKQFSKLDLHLYYTHISKCPGSNRYMHSCDICNKTFACRSTLIIHKTTHAGGKPFSCDLCQQRFANNSTLNNHKRTLHMKRRGIFFCKVCVQQFDDKYSFKMHMLIHKKKLHPCTVCELRFTEKADLIAHKLVHTSEKPYECELCQRRFTQKGHLNDHLRLHTGYKPYECDICKKKFAFKSPLTVHRRRHTGEKPHECYVCPKRFACRTGLVNHIRKNHKDVHLLHYCDICGEKFEYRDQLSAHKRTHTDKKYSCDVCLKEFSYNYFKIHQRTHTKEKFTCELCQKQFNSADSLTLHKKLVHAHEIHTCEVCNRGFGDKDALNEHLLTHEKIFICDLCKNIFRHKHNLRAHILTHTGNKPYCGYTYSDEQFVRKVSLDAHMNVRKEPLHVCGVCGKRFYYESNFKKHEKNHTVIKSIIKVCCETCGKLMGKSSLAAHKLMHMGLKLHYCDICNKGFSHLPNLKRHKLLHTEPKDKRYCCDICGKQFVLRDTLNSHIKWHTATKKHFCVICNKGFVNLMQLNNHKRIHTGEKPFICDICNKRFRTKARITAHMIMHTGQKPFQCDVCNQQFRHSTTLRRHKFRHTGVKPYVCNICSKAFALQQTLNKHIMIHTGEKPHVCDICNKAFSAKTRLRIHLLIHTGERPYPCTMCNKAFRTNSKLNEHMASKHKKNY